MGLALPDLQFIIEIIIMIIKIVRYCSKDRQQMELSQKTHAFMELIYDRSDISDQWDYLENCPLRQLSI